MSPANRAKLLLVDDQVENLIALEAVLEPLGQELVRDAEAVAPPDGGENFAMSLRMPQ